jgi:hypothetical protein
MKNPLFLMMVCAGTLLGCVADTAGGYRDGPDSPISGKADQAAGTLSQRLDRELVFKGTVAEGATFRDEALQAGGACELAFVRHDGKVHVWLDLVPPAGSDRGFRIDSTDDFTANGFRSMQEGPRGLTGVAKPQWVRNNWFDENVNGLSLIEENQVVESGLWGQTEVPDVHTLYIQLSADRSTVTNFRYTHSHDDDQDSVVDCWF